MRGQLTRTLIAAALIGTIALAGCSTELQETLNSLEELAPAAGPTETAEPDPHQEAYGLYAAKVAEYVALYGEPSYEGPAESGYETQTGTGLNLVLLRDYDGDGIEELVLGHRNPDESDYMHPYVVEVWAVRDGGLVCALDDPDAFSHGQDVLTGFEDATIDGEPVVLTTTYGPSEVGERSGGGAYALRDGSFVEVLSYLQEYSFDGSVNVFTVNGAQSSAEGYRAAMERPVTSDYWSLMGYGAATPGEGVTLHTVPETVAEAQRVIALLEDSVASGADDRAGETAYVAADVPQEITVSAYQAGSGSWEETNLWSYPQFKTSDGEEPEQLARLNETLEQEFVGRLAAQRLMTAEGAAGDGSGAAEQILWCYDTTASIDGSVASVRLDRYSYYGGAHGTRYVSGKFYDLDAGTEIPATEALGMSENELKLAAKSGLQAFLAKNPSDLGGDIDYDRAVNDLFLENRTFIYRTDHAIVACFTEGTLGSVAFGGHEVVIVALDDQAEVGDDLVESHRL